MTLHMGWIISKLLKITMIAIFVGIIAGVGLLFFVNPNHFKPQITKMMQDYTGQAFQINGDIEWSLRPRTIINIHDVVLASSADDKTPAVQIKEINLDFDIFALLRNNMTIHSVVLNNVVVDWLKAKAMTANKPDKPGRQCLIQDLEVKNGAVTLQDPDEHLNWSLQNVELTANNVMMNSGQGMPTFLMHGDLSNMDFNTKYTLDTTVTYDSTKSSLTLDPLKVIWNDTSLQGDAIIDQSGAAPIISGTISLNPTDVGALLKKLDPYYANNPAKVTHTLQMQTDYSYALKDQTLDLTKLQLQIDKGVLTGDVKLGLVSPYHAEFSLSAENLDFAPLGMLGTALFPSIHTMNAIPSAALKDIVVSGKFSGTQLTVANDIVMDQFHLEVNGQGGVIQFTPVIINAYGGTHNVALSIDVSKKDPEFMLNEKADKVDIEPWFKAIQGDSILSGKASVQVSLKASGNELATIKQSLAGSVNVSVNNGVMYGFDANKVMQFSLQTVTDIFNEISTSPAANLNVLAVKQSSDWIKTQQDNPQTKFDHFEFVAEIAEGISKKSSIAMNNNVIDLKGTGQYTLHDQAINYTATMVDRMDPNTDIKVLAGYMKQTPINLNITGTINKPVFGPDVQTYITTVLKATQTDLVTLAVNKMVAATPPNMKTGKTASDLFIDSLQSLNLNK